MSGTTPYTDLGIRGCARPLALAPFYNRRCSDD